MKRRNVLKSIGALSWGLASCGGSGVAVTPPPPTNARPPNVLMISLDDLNDWVGFLGGHPQVRTPGMDALAARSTVFERAYCNVPLCSPSRASVLSGRYAHETGVHANNQSLASVGWSGSTLDAEMVRAGYATKLLGKIYHDYTSPIPLPLPDQLPASNIQCSGMPNLPPEGAFDWAALPVDDADMPDARLVSDAIAFMDANLVDRPFFLGVGLVRTHVPWYVPKRWFDLYPTQDLWLPPVPPDDLEDLGAIARSLALVQNFNGCITKQGLWAAAVRGFLASISFVDSQVARLITALENSRHASNTVVVLWSDNGFHLGEKFHWHKATLWEPATRVPFLIRRPTDVGARVQSVVSLIDLFPTLLDVCGIPKSMPLSGRSLLPLLDSVSTPWDHPALMSYTANHYAVRDTRWRYIRYSGGEEELYDHASDPSELRNVAADLSLADVKARLRSHIPG